MAPSRVAQEFNVVAVNGSHGFGSDWNNRVQLHLFSGTEAYFSIFLSAAAVAAVLFGM